MLDDKKNDVENNAVRFMMESMGKGRHVYIVCCHVFYVPVYITLGEMMDGFLDHQSELQAEMHLVLDNSRMEMLTHEELLSLLTGEQMRTQFLSKIFGGFKSQLEKLFYAMKGRIDNEEAGDRLNMSTALY